VEVPWSAALARRLARHHLTDPAGSAAEVAAAVCGVHAQILTAGELSIGQRLAGARRDEVRAALWDSRELVKTFGPRGTVHLLPTSDLPRWTGALAALPRPLPSFDPSVRLTPAQLDEVVAGIGAVLADAELTIDELDAALADEVGAWAVERCMPAFQDLWPRWRQAVDTAANRGVLCFGPVRDRKVTYTSPQRWSPGFAPAPGPAAVTWLARSYLRSYGPARPEHFAQWLSVAKPWATQLFRTLEAAGEIEPVGPLGWVVAGDIAFPTEAPRGLRLLPYFDAYVVGSHPRELVYPGAAAERAQARRQAGNYQVLLVDGVVAGVWHQERSGRYVDVTVEPVIELSAARRRDLDAETERVGAFGGLTPRLTIGTVTVGPHA
jgi:Winged helix DNA-binding domain